MKTARELSETLDSCAWHRVDAHVHTHLCDGREDMTIENIARRAQETGVDLIILTPHFHKQVSDPSGTLYHDSDPAIFHALREEIDCYARKDGRVRFLLSTEVDILSEAGDLSLTLTGEIEKSLDMITPTMNYHPLLPLKAVHLTYMKDIDPLHESGEYARMVQDAGGLEKIIGSIYETAVNAIENAPCTAMLGHFLAAHSIANQKYSWFDMQKEHMDIIKSGARRVIEVCRKKQAMIDLTGIHLRNETPEHKREKDGFLYDFQRWFINECRREGVPAYPGSDAHALHRVGNSRVYGEIFGEYDNFRQQ